MARLLEKNKFKQKTAATFYEVIHGSRPSATVKLYLREEIPMV
jgi:hypothetical protein